MESTRWSRFRQSRSGWFFGLIVHFLGVVAFGIVLLFIADLRNQDLYMEMEVIKIRLNGLEDDQLEAAIKQVKDARDANKPIPQFMVVDQSTATALSAVVEWWSVDNDKDRISDNGWDDCHGSTFTSLTDINAAGCTAQQLFVESACKDPKAIEGSPSTMELSCTGDQKIHCAVVTAVDGTKSWGACSFPSGS